MSNANAHYGFTLVEIMVAVTIFTIVVVIGMGALITANGGYSASRSQRHAVDAVTTSMEYMTRQLRTGSLYACGDLNAVGVTLDATTIRQDCFGAAHDTAITFIDQDGRQISLWLQDDPSQPGRGRIMRTVNTGALSTEPLTDTSVVDIDSFYVHIDGLSPDDDAQPLATITIIGRVLTTANTTFQLQASASQRTLDVPPATQ